ncbi:hypothetical protein [Loktanella sp. R86503]|uniref:hypothetical protein n=1 Tax=Loktanella sp. R86503 TaxID=3093847 RepID=UPI0036DBA1A2
MLDNRIDPALVTPGYEDAGLFKYDLCRLHLSLLPGVRRNARADFVFDGVIDGKYCTPVFFAGRRAKQAAMMLATISRRFRGSAAVSFGAAPNVTAPNVAAYDSPALALQIDGAWRNPVVEGDDGFARPAHQFIAAVWTITAGCGPGQQFGALPVR